MKLIPPLIIHDGKDDHVRFAALMKAAPVCVLPTIAGKTPPVWRAYRARMSMRPTCLEGDEWSRYS